MTVLDELYEAATSDAPGSARFPLYTRAPTDEGAAAAGSPFVHLVTARGSGRVVVRFWCDDRPSGPLLRVDYEPLEATFLWPGGRVRATSAFVAAMIAGTFFETYAAGWYREKGVRTLGLRDVRDGTVVTLDHTLPFDETRDVTPTLERAAT